MSTSAETAPAVTVPDNAAALVLLAVLERRERAAWRVDYHARLYQQAQLEREEELDAGDELWRHGLHMRWAQAWETLGDARRALGMES